MSDSPFTTDTTSQTLQDLARRAGPIARNAQLVALNVRKLAVELHVPPGLAFRPATLDSEHVVEHSFAPKDGDAPNTLTVIARFRAGVTADEDKQRLLSFEAELAAEYVLPDSMPADATKDLGAFAQTNGMIHMWPYYRELLHNMTWRMGLPPFPVPLFRITDPVPTKKP